jgi:hypothetical protein
MRNRSMSQHAMLYAVIFLCLSIAADGFGRRDAARPARAAWIWI